jgi:cyanophycinase
MRPVTAGTLMLIGGGEDRTHEYTVLLRFLQLAGGADARIVIIGTASTVPEELGAEYVEAFRSLGCGDVDVLPLGSRDEAASDGILATLRAATGVYFMGGDQARIAAILGGSPVDDLLHELHAQGLVIAGTSAGAAMMSATMILGGRERVPTPDVPLGRGLGFVSGLVVDMHFAERGRLSRLLSVVALCPELLGIGIDEDTAVVVTGHQFEVVGSGTVSVVDGGTVTYLRTPPDGSHAPIALTGATLHVLPAGYAFELSTRTPVVIEAPAGAVAYLDELERPREMSSAQG